jgi:hypothetical protein
MTAARASVPGSPTAAAEPASERSRAPAQQSAPGVARGGLSPAAGNRALARALSDAAASRTLAFADAAAKRTLARCPGCGGTCGGTCGAGKTELDEDLLDSGQRALRRAVLARRRRAVSPRS